MFKWNRHRCANTEGLRTTTNKQEGWIANSNWTDRQLPKHMSNEQRSMNQIGCWWKIDATNTRRGFTFDNPKNACTVAHLRTHTYTYTCIYSHALHVQMDQIVFILSHVHCLKLKSRVRKEKIKQNKIKIEIKTWKQFGCDHNYGPVINKIMNCNEDVWTLRLSSYTMAQLR